MTVVHVASPHLVGVLIRFASQAEATEAHAALLELMPTHIWLAFVVGYIPEDHYQTSQRGDPERFSLFGGNVPAAAPSARSQNVKVSAK